MGSLIKWSLVKFLVGEFGGREHRKITVHQTLVPTNVSPHP